MRQEEGCHLRLAFVSLVGYLGSLLCPACVSVLWLQLGRWSYLL